MKRPDIEAIAKRVKTPRSVLHGLWCEYAFKDRLALLSYVADLERQVRGAVEAIAMRLDADPH